MTHETRVYMQVELGVWYDHILLVATPVNFFFSFFFFLFQGTDTLSRKKCCTLKNPTCYCL